MPADTVLTVLTCTSVATLGALAVVVLPWRAQELTESWLAWRVLVSGVRAALGRLREAPPAPLRPVPVAMRTAA